MMTANYEAGFRSVLLLGRMDASGKKCGKGYISASKECRSGKTTALRSPQSKNWYDDEHNIGMAYDFLGGDDYAKELTQLNPKFNNKDAKNYIREMGRAYLIAQEDNKQGNEEMEKVNRKYQKYFDR